MDLFSQDLNPVTGDIGFNPASFGLSLKDIDKAASIKLKAALTSGGLALTQEQYREVLKISETKYQGLDAQSGIFDGSVLPDVDMSSKDPGLYLTQEYMGYWTGTEWASYIGNNGNFEFQGNTNNYIRWNGTALDIRGVLQMTDGTLIEDYIEANGTKPMVNSQYDSGLDKYKQWLSAGDLLPYTIPGSATGVYMTSQGLFGVKNGVNQFSISSSTGDAMFRGTVYASGGEFNGNITANGTITGGSIIGSTIKTGLTGQRTEISGNNIRGYDSSGVLRIQTANAGMRFTDFTGMYNSDISGGAFELSGGSMIWPYIIIGDASGNNRVGLRTAYITGTTQSVGVDFYLRGGQISFRGVNNVVGSGVILTSPDDNTLVVSGTTITLNGKNLYSDGVNLYWDGTKIN